MVQSRHIEISAAITIGPTNSPNSPKVSDPAEDAEQDPHKRQPRRAADQKWSDEMIGDENHEQAKGDYAHRGAGIALGHQIQSGAPEGHRGAEWDHGENPGQRRK